VTREEWLGLPSALALAVLYDGNAKIRELVDAADKPQLPRPPKYDMKMYRKGGWNYASELNLESLVFWHGKAVESAQGGGEYAEKDQKKAAALSYWINWRRVEPTTAWSGERDRKQVKANPPSRDPELHSALPSNDDRGDYESAPGDPF